MNILDAASAAKAASIQLAAADAVLKNHALREIAVALSCNSEAIIAANADDLRYSE